MSLEIVDQRSTRIPIAHLSKSLRFYLPIHTGNVLLKFRFNVQNQTEVTYLKINRLWPMPINNMHMKFEIQIPKKPWVLLWKPCHLQSPDTEQSNMAARRPFWMWHCWKSIGFFPCILPIYRLLPSQSKIIRVWKPKNPIWLPGGHFESDIAENKETAVHSHKEHAYEIWNWNSKPD